MRNSLVNKYFSEAIIISALPVIAYGLSYHFEAGYLSYFDLPAYLAEVSLESFFSAFLVLCFFLLMLTWVVDTFIEFLTETSGRIPANFKEHGFLFLKIPFFYFPIILAYLFVSLRDEFRPLSFSVAIMFAFLMTLEYLSPLIIGGRKEYFRILGEYRADETIRKKNTLTNKVIGLLGSRFYLLIIFLIVFFPILSRGVGYLSADSAETYLTSYYKGNNYALVRAYSDKKIYAELKRNWYDLYSYEYKPNGKFLLLNEFLDNSKYQRLDRIN